MKLISIALVLLSCSLCHAFNTYRNSYGTGGTTIYNTTVAVPSNMYVDGQMYEANISGIKQYFTDDLSVSAPEVYQKLLPELSDLERRQTNAAIVGWSSLVGGLILALVPNEKGPCEIESAVNPNECLIHEEKYTNLYAGIGIMLVGATVSWAMKPKRKDYLNFFNRHNRLRREAPIELRLGYSKKAEAGLIGMSYKF